MAFCTKCGKPVTEVVEAYCSSCGTPTKAVASVGRKTTKSDVVSGPISAESKRARAEKWVNGYTATAVATVLATAVIPGAATAILCSLEATMCYQIGKIYRHQWSTAEATTAAGVVGMAAFVGQIAALEAAILTGPGAFFIKPAIAAGIVKAMGKLVIKHFEDATD